MPQSWNNPVVTTPKSDVLTHINNKLQSLAKADYGDDVDLPNGAVRYDASSKKWQKWDGTTWNSIDLVVTGIDGDSVIVNGDTSLSLQIADTEKLLLDNSELLIKTPTKINASNLNLHRTDTPEFYIHTGTEDGADNKALVINGGGLEYGSNRGAFLHLNGNEHANAGKAYLTSGNASGSQLHLQVAQISKLFATSTELNAQVPMAVSNNSATSQTNKTIYTSWSGRPAQMGDDGRWHGRRLTYTISANPSNLSSGGTKYCYYQLDGDLCHVAIMISAYTASAGATTITWDCLPFNKATSQRPAFAVSYYGAYSGFRWQPATARCDSGSTIEIRRYDGIQAFASGTTWLCINGSYFWK